MTDVDSISDAELEMLYRGCGAPELADDAQLLLLRALHELEAHRKSRAAALSEAYDMGAWKTQRDADLPWQKAVHAELARLGNGSPENPSLAARILSVGSMLPSTIGIVVREAVLSERDACVQIAFDAACLDVASSIRARGGRPTITGATAHQHAAGICDETCEGWQK